MARATTEVWLLNDQYSYGSGTSKKKLYGKRGDKCVIHYRSHPQSEVLILHNPATGETFSIRAEKISLTPVRAHVVAKAPPKEYKRVEHEDYVAPTKHAAPVADKPAKQAKPTKQAKPVEPPKPQQGTLW